MVKKTAFVSLILPIRNEARHIEDTLSSVLVQDYPHNHLEILIADGMSTDNTRSIIQNALKVSNLQPANFQLINNYKEIVPAALNVALRQAKGVIIIRVDGHTKIAPDYVSQCVAALQRTDADNVGGKMNAVGENFFGEAVAIATSSPFGVGGARFHYSDEEEWVDTVYMGAWRRDVFERIGLFDEELVRDQDDEFNYRLRADGGKILLSPKIKSTYIVRGTIQKLWTQYYQYGYWKVRVMQKHPRQMRPRQFVPPTFVSALLTGIILAVFSSDNWIPLAILCGSYLVANLTAAFLIAKQDGWHYLPLLPIIYAILHMSYGLGFLMGLIRFAHRWGDKEGNVPVFQPMDVERSTTSTCS